MRIKISYNEHIECWVVEENVKLAIENKIVTVPRGFRSDLASVPRLFWSIYPPFGKYGEAAIVHDYLYKNRVFSRRKCDKYFLLLMKRAKVSVITRYFFYLSVRLFGWLRY